MKKARLRILRHKHTFEWHHRYWLFILQPTWPFIAFKYENLGFDSTTHLLKSRQSSSLDIIIEDYNKKGCGKMYYHFPDGPYDAYERLNYLTNRHKYLKNSV